MKQINYSPVAKKFYDFILNSSMDSACQINQLIKSYDAYKEITDITDQEIDILKKAFDILNDKADKIEEYLDSVDQFYKPY